MALPLDLSPHDFQELAAAIVQRSAVFLGERPNAPAADFDGLDDLFTAIRLAPPERGVDFERVLDIAFQAGRKGHDTTGPGWLAYIPGGGLPSAALADLIARVTNRFVTSWETAPVMAEIEATVIRWLCQLFGYGSTARGVLTTGGSLANFSAVVAARHSRLGERFQKGTIYVTSETHGSVAKAAVLAGFPRSAVRLLPVMGGLRMDAEALKNLVKSDRSKGLMPFAVVASAGTTNTGAVDPIGAIADVAERDGLWLHVDAAYGGFFQLTKRGETLFSGIDRADSITLDPHKGMFLPYGTGALLVRDGQLLRAAHEVHGAYLQDLAPEHDIPNFSDYSAELSRDSRGLRVWLPIQIHGLAAFRDALDEKLDLAQEAAAGLRTVPGIDVPWEPELSIVAFRLTKTEWAAPELATAELLRRLNALRRFVLSSTVVDGRFTIRIAILSFRTHRERIEETINAIRTETARMLRGE